MLIDLDGGIKLHHILIVDDFIYREEILIAEHDDHMLSLNGDRFNLHRQSHQLTDGG